MVERLKQCSCRSGGWYGMAFGDWCAGHGQVQELHRLPGAVYAVSLHYHTRVVLCQATNDTFNFKALL